MIKRSSLFGTQSLDKLRPDKRSGWVGTFDCRSR